MCGCTVFWDDTAEDTARYNLRTNAIITLGVCAVTSCSVLLKKAATMCILVPTHQNGGNFNSFSGQLIVLLFFDVSQIMMPFDKEDFNPPQTT